MKKFYAFVVSLFLFISASAQTTIYVDSGRAGSGSGSGTSWNTAYKELRDAITAANGQTGTVQILVAKGTYKPTVSNRRDTSFVLSRGGLKLLGGYASGGGVRNAALYPTILSGDIGAANNTTDNSYHIVVIAGIAASADSLVMDGFIITRGNADEYESKTYNGQSIENSDGGGIAIAGGGGSKTSLRNCTLTGNRADNRGGGMYIYNSSPTITNCTLTGNSTLFFGGGMYMDHSSPTITNCAFTGNSTIYYGGGMYMDDSSPTITNCTFTGNIADYNGGGMYMQNSFPTITNCTITGNSAAYGGGGINIQVSSPIIINCTITGNIADYNGGGMAIDGNSSPKITNCIIWVNTALSGASIFGGNATSVVTYSIVQGGYAGTGNLSTDPLFVNSADPDGADNIFGTADDGLKLQPPSPAINSGNNSAVPAGVTTDITGAARIQSGTVDMGSYENNPCPASTIVYVDSAKATSGAGSSWANAYKTLTEALVVANRCTSVTQIWVAKGTYQPAAGASYTMVPNVKIYGGFASGATLLSQRNFTANPTILKGNGNCVISNNNGLSAGAVLDGFTITGGNAATGGGMLNTSNSSPTVTNCIFSANTVSDSGGGMLNTSNSSPTVTNCTFSANTAVDGGGMYNDNSSPRVTNCTFSANTTSHDGGGIFNIGYSSPTVTNCTFSANMASRDGGGMDNIFNSSPTVTNCTFSANTANTGGGIYNLSNSSPTVTNCIIWGNTASTGPAIYNSGATTTVTYSIVQDGFTGTGNLNTDPLFVNAGDPDGADNIYGTADDGLRLQSPSPAINTGNTAAIPPGITTDITGAARVQQGAVDRGAYESPYASLTKYYVDNSLAASGSGGTWATAFKELSDAVLLASVNPDADSILVAQGTYKPTSDANRDSAFVLTRGGLKLYGGYPSGGAGTRDPLANTTILSGDIGVANNTTDNSYHVVVAAAIPSAADSLVMDGFMITKGNANGTATKSYNGQTLNQNDGAGVSLIVVANKTVFRNCIFSSNVSTGNGGAVSNSVAAPSFFNCLLTGNKAAFGGGLFNFMANSILTNCTLTRDTATSSGGGMRNNNSSPVITNSIIWNNRAVLNGNAIDNSMGSPAVSYSIVQDGYAGTGNLNADPIFVNASNPAGTDGIFGTTDDGLRLQQCSPAINSASLAALPAGMDADISGFTRVFNTLPDIGAYEYRAIGEGSSLGINGDDSTYVIRTGVMPLLVQGCRIVSRVTANGANPINGTLASKLWIDAAFPMYNSQNFIKRHFQLTPSGGATATLTLYATQQEFTDFNTAAMNDLPASPTDADGVARLRIYKFAGQSSNATGLPATYAQAPVEINPDDAQVVWNVNQQRWQITFTVTGFSGFFIGAANSPILPLTLLQFKGTVAGSKEALLSWRTANEVNTSYFELQRSSDGRSFTAIATLQATGTAQGEAAYSYSDNNLQPGLYYYRLRMIDKDGKETYSQLVSVQFKGSNLLVLYPVPAKDVLWLGGSTLTQRGKSALLTDIQGRVLQHIRIEQWPQPIDISTLARGTYLLKMEGETAIPFMKQ